MKQDPDAPQPTIEAELNESDFPQVTRSASYLATFGFHRDPFPMAPDDQRFFHPKRIDILLTEILHALLTRKGLVLLSGSIGQGKTTLIHRIHHELKSAGVETILFSNTFLQGEMLVEAIARAFGVTWEGSGLSNVLEALFRHFKGRAERGINCAILVDDAQELSTASLEMIRLISNLEHHSQKLVQILLVGQEKLNQHLGSEPLQQLASRVVSKVETHPFTYNETVQYLTFKLITAGCNECIHLSRWAMGTLHRLSGGNPRRINILMDRALYAAYALDQNRISSALLRKVAREVQFHPPASPLRWGLLLALGIVAGAAALTMSGVWSPWTGLPGMLQPPSSSQTSAPAKVKKSPPAEAPGKPEPTVPAPTQAATPKAPAPAATAPQAPHPATPQAPHPSATAPQAPSPAATAPQAPSPATTAPQAPSPAATTPQAPSPAATTPQAPAADPVKPVSASTEAVAPPVAPPEAVQRTVTDESPAASATPPTPAPDAVQTATTPQAAPSPPTAPEEPTEVPEVMARFLEAYGLAAHGQTFVKAWLKEDWDGFSAHIEKEAGLRMLRMRRPPDWVKRIYPILKVRQDLHLLIWRPAAEVAGVKEFGTGYQGEEIRRLQTALTRLGFYTMPVDGMVGSGLRQAISLFQQSKGLPVNGQPNEVTLFFLSHALQDAARPSP